MKIGMILDNRFTGDLRVENEVRTLRENGIEVSVLCYAMDNEPIHEYFHGAKITRIKVIKKWIKKLKGLNNTIFNLFPIYWSKKITKFIEHEKITHLHVHDLWMLESALRANKKFKLPFIADIHENFVFALANYKYSSTFPGNILISQKKWAKDEIKWLKQVDKIIVVIEEAKCRMINLGIPSEKIVVLPNYVNISEYSKVDEQLAAKLKAAQKDRFVITYIGGFDYHRGLNIAIQAIPKVIKQIPNIKLQLVGGGIIDAELRKQVKTLRIEEYVDFPGYQAHKNLPSFIKSSDVCLIPHIKTPHTDNTIPHKLFQYMLMEKPVIASDCDPLVRIMEETAAGYIYNSYSPEALAKTIIKVYKTEHNKIGLNGKRAVLEKYNWVQVEKNLLNIYADQEVKKNE